MKTIPDTPYQKCIMIVYNVATTTAETTAVTTAATTAATTAPTSISAHKTRQQ